VKSYSVVFEGFFRGERITVRVSDVWGKNWTEATELAASFLHEELLDDYKVILVKELE
jgi:hypothetical protein